MGRSSPRSRSFVHRALHLDRGSGPTPLQADGGDPKNGPGLTGGPSTDKGGELTGPNPTDRAKRGTKYHLLVDAGGLPLNVAVSGANRNDSMLVEPILDSMPAIKRGGRGHPRRRPVKLHADKGYDIPRVQLNLHSRRRSSARDLGAGLCAIRPLRGGGR